MIVDVIVEIVGRIGFVKWNRGFDFWKKNRVLIKSYEGFDSDRKGLIN